MTTYSHELISTSPLTSTLTPPSPSNWMNYLGFLSLDDQDTDGELPLLVSLRLPLPLSQLPYFNDTKRVALLSDYDCDDDSDCDDEDSSSLLSEQDFGL